MTDITFTVSLSEAADEAVTVTATTVDGEATSGTEATAARLGRDFVPKTEALEFAAGETEKQFVVTLVDDTFDELASETFTVVLSESSVNAGLLDAEATGTITDNDDPMEVGVYTEATTVDENADGNVVFRFEVSPAASNGTTATELQTAVLWQLKSGTATLDEDFAAVEPGLFVLTEIPPGVSTKSVEVGLVDDDLFEPLDEAFTFVISQPASQPRPGTGPPVHRNDHSRRQHHDGECRRRLRERGGRRDGILQRDVG